MVRPQHKEVLQVTLKDFLTNNPYQPKNQLNTGVSTPSNQQSRPSVQQNSTVQQSQQKIREIGQKLQQMYPDSIYPEKDALEVGQRYLQKNPDKVSQILGERPDVSFDPLEGISPATRFFGGIQEDLAKSKTLPTVYGTYGSVLGALMGGHSSAGAGVGGSVGEWQRQWLGKGGLQGAVPSKKEAVQIGTTGGKMALADWLVGKAFKTAGKGVKKIGQTEPVQNVIKAVDDKIVNPAVNRIWNPIKRKMLAQIMHPTRIQLINSFTKEGISETLEEAQERNITGTARQIFVQARRNMDEIGGTAGSKGMIDDYLEMYADDLPKIEMDEVVKRAGLDDVVRQYSESLGEETSESVAKEVGENVSKMGTKNFDEAYRIMKDWGRFLRKAYGSDSLPSDIASEKLTAVMKLNNAGRQYLKEKAEDEIGGAAGKRFAKMLDDFHFWANLKAMAEVGTAEAQGPLSSLQQLLFGQVIPTAIGTGQRIVGDVAVPAVTKTAKQVPQAIKSLMFYGATPERNTQ